MDVQADAEPAPDQNHEAKDFVKKYKEWNEYRFTLRKRMTRLLPILPISIAAFVGWYRGVIQDLEQKRLLGKLSKRDVIEAFFMNFINFPTTRSSRQVFLKALKYVILTLVPTLFVIYMGQLRQRSFRIRLEDENFRRAVISELKIQNKDHWETEFRDMWRALDEDLEWWFVGGNSSTRYPFELPRASPTDIPEFLKPSSKPSFTQEMLSMFQEMTIF